MKGDLEHAAMRRRNAELIASGAETVQEQQSRCAFISNPREAQGEIQVLDEEIVVFSPCASP